MFSNSFLKIDNNNEKEKKNFRKILFKAIFSINIPAVRWKLIKNGI